jgi:hypothetical protein
MPGFKLDGPNAITNESPALMKGILADHNADGHLEVLLRTLLSDDWLDMWNELDVPVLTFVGLGLAPDVDDVTLWRTCQHEQVVLITNNRNAEGPESLQYVLDTETTIACLPVLTLANAERIRTDKRYAEQTAVRLLEYLLDIENYRGTARIYVP